MGGKDSGAAAPPPVEAPAPGFDPMMMMQFFTAMMGSFGGQEPPAPPQIPDAPAVEKDPKIDFKERNDQLRRQIKADFTREEATRRGRTDTILTSPLLDEDLQPDAGSLITEDA